MAGQYFVYILASQRNGTLYVGVTNDLNRRITAHKAKAVPGFTKQYGVDRLVHVEGYSSILEARARERALKRWRRAWKIQLIEKEILSGETCPATSDYVSRAQRGARADKFTQSAHA